MKVLHDRIQTCPRCGARNQMENSLAILLHMLTEHEHRDVDLTPADTVKVLTPGVYREWGWSPEVN